MERDEDPPEPGSDSFWEGIGLTEYLERLSHLAKEAVCPVCGKNRGWLKPSGIERIQVDVVGNEQSLEALLYACDQCGFLRLHLVSQYRI